LLPHNPPAHAGLPCVRFIADAPDRWCQNHTARVNANDRLA